jgi:hypothetical protein
LASLLKLSRISWRDLTLTLGPFVVLLAVTLWIASRFVHPAPPDTITITSGPEGSTFATVAERYRKILARQGVKLKVLPSQGSLENLKRLADPKAQVDIGFVQGGLASQADTSDLYSLGSIFYTPVYVFYRAPKPIARLAELSGKRISIGREGSGTHVLATTLLRANGIDGKGATKLLDLEGKAAEDGLQGRQIDAAFLMGDSATFANTRELIHTEGIRVFDFQQADGYVLRFRYLSKLQVPPGALDLGKNLPGATLTLVSPTVELIARSDLHPALSDMLIEAAREVHGRPNLFQKAGEFPAPLEHEYRISDDASRYYKSGKTFAYRYLPFWLASLVDRIIVVLLPLAVLLIPGFKVVPWLYRWRINQRIYRRYAELMALERAAFSQTTPKERADLLQRLDKIEEQVIRLRLPGSFAEQGYILRQHIGFVRSRLAQAGG